MITKKIGLGGGCHWCTEAYFQSLMGVEKVEQGWISSLPPNESFSEAVLVNYNPLQIPLKILIAIHLHTHASTIKHSFRKKYRLAVYDSEEKILEVKKLIAECQVDFEEEIITEVLLFQQFKLNAEQQQNYYFKKKEGEFCQRYISPKLQLLKKQYSTYYKEI